MFKVISATSIDSKGKTDIITTGVKNIVRQFLPDDTDQPGNDMSFIEGWLSDEDPEQADDDAPQVRQKKPTLTARYIKHKGKGKKTRKR